MEKKKGPGGSVGLERERASFYCAVRRAQEKGKGRFEKKIIARGGKGVFLGTKKSQEKMTPESLCRGRAFLFIPKGKEMAGRAENFLARKPQNSRLDCCREKRSPSGRIKRT